MPEEPKTQLPKHLGPLWLIALFLSFSEVALGLGVANTTGTQQITLIIFSIVFPILIFTLFFLLLWYKPYVLYGPKEFAQGADVQAYVTAMQSKPSTQVIDVKDPSLTGPSDGAGTEKPKPQPDAMEELMPSASLESSSNEQLDDETSGWNLIHKGNYEQGLALIKQAAARTQSHQDQIDTISFAQYFSLTNGVKEALGDLQKTAADNPRSLKSKVWLGAALSYTGRDEDAIRILSSVLSEARQATFR